LRVKSRSQQGRNERKKNDGDIVGVKNDNERRNVGDKRIPVWHRFMSQAGTNNDFEIYKHDRFASRACTCICVCVCVYACTYKK
jgi:hypothetical protein